MRPDGRWRSSTADRRSAAMIAPVIVFGLVRLAGQLAAGIRHHRRARPDLARGLPRALPAARRASAAVGRRARATSSRDVTIPAHETGRAARLQHVAPAAADVGLRPLEDVHRPGVVLHHRLVRGLSRRASGFALEESLAGFLIPFLAADLGNFFGGGLSSRLIARGWSVGAARKLIAIIGGLGMMMLIPTVWSSSFVVIVSCFAVATFSYAAFSTIILNLPADIFPSRERGLGQRPRRHRRRLRHDCRHLSSPAGWPTTTRSSRSCSARASSRSSRWPRCCCSDPQHARDRGGHRQARSDARPAALHGLARCALATCVAPRCAVERLRAATAAPGSPTDSVAPFHVAQSGSVTSIAARWRGRAAIGAATRPVGVDRVERAVDAQIADVVDARGPRERALARSTSRTRRLAPMPMSRDERRDPGAGDHRGVLHQRVQQARAVLGQRLVAARIRLLDAPLASASSAVTSATKLRRTSAASGCVALIGPVSISTTPRSPARDVVAKRAHLELVAVATHLAGRERLDRVADDRPPSSWRGSDCGLSLRASSCATASSEIDAGRGGLPTDVDQF